MRFSQVIPFTLPKGYFTFRLYRKHLGGVPTLTVVAAAMDFHQDFPTKMPIFLCLAGVKRTSFGTDKTPVFGVKIF
jgi:hypothetical protein